MKKLRIYLDTSVLGGCFDPEFAPWSNSLIDDFRNGVYRPILSDVTATEVVLAPGAVQNLYAELLQIADSLAATQEVVSLLGGYEKKAILGPRYRNDMLHIALATVGNADAMVSWNFRHIVRLDKIRSFNATNLELGYQTLSIRSPREVATHGREDQD